MLGSRLDAWLHWGVDIILKNGMGTFPTSKFLISKNVLTKSWLAVLPRLSDATLKFWSQCIYIVPL